LAIRHAWRGHAASSAADTHAPRLHLDEIPGLVSTLGRDGQLQFANKQMLGFYGRALEHLRDWPELLHPDDRSRFLKLWHGSVDSADHLDLELRTRGADGCYRWMAARISPHRDAQGRTIRWCIVLTDIDDIKRADEALRSSEHDLRLIIDNIPGFAYTLTPQGEIEQVNRRITEFFGVSADELRDWRRVTHPDSIEHVTMCLKHSMDTGELIDCESRGRRADGVYRWFQVRGMPLRDADGKIVRWYLLLTDIEEHKQAEEALRANERHLRLLLDSIPAFIHTLTPTGEVAHVNQRVIDFFGLPSEELRDWSRVTHPDDVGRIGAIIEHALKTGTPFEFESRGRRADGVYRWMHGRCMPLRDSQGHIIRWYGVFTDIDDRRRMEEALRASEQQLRLMVDSIPGLICTNTAAGEVEYVNQTLLDYTGKDLAELRNWPVVVHPEDLPRAAARWQHSIRTGDPFGVEVRVQRADGAYRWFQCSGLPLRDSAGAIVRWYNLLTDIEDRKLTEEVLRARERDLALIVETIPALVWCASAEGEFTYANSRILQLTGATFEELATKWTEYVHPDELDSVVEVWRRSLRTGEPHEVQHRLRCADGSYRWIQSIGQLGRDSDGRPTRWYGLFIDIDERLNTEEALRNTRARLARATQVATVGELSASIAHEINQPLSAVVTNGHACLSWLTADPPNIPRAVLSLERIIRDGRAAADVIQRIRALYRHAPPSKDELSINEVIEEVESLIAADARRQSVVLRVELQKSLPPVLGDRVQLQQVLSNLARNAIEAMETVTTHARELRIQSLHHEHQVIVQVRDTGTGMPDYSNAFEPFFTTKAHGMGMGLAICRSIVEAHGGQLRASHATPSGSVFSFSLPVAERITPPNPRKM
jgi:PAS domain S-box-containing protein